MSKKSNNYKKELYKIRKKISNQKLTIQYNKINIEAHKIHKLHLIDGKDKMKKEKLQLKRQFLLFNTFPLSLRKLLISLIRKKVKSH